MSSSGSVGRCHVNTMELIMVSSWQSNYITDCHRQIRSGRLASATDWGITNHQ